MVCLPLLVDAPAGINCKSNGGYQPSDLYQTITAYTAPFDNTALIENNKLAIIENLKDKSRKNILVVEDDADIRYLLNDILKEDYIIYEAEDGFKALELVEKIIPDLVVCDVMMPNMGGLELCNRMKNAPATCHIPFIILSARGSEEHHMEGTNWVQTLISPNHLIQLILNFVFVNCLNTGKSYRNCLATMREQTAW